MAKTIKGLFVAVELDQSKLAKGVKTAVNTLKTEFEGVRQSIDDSLKLDSSEITNKLTSVAKTLSRIQNAISTKSGGEAFADAVRESDALKASLDEVAKQAGISSEVLQNTFSKAIKANEVKATVGAVRSLARTLGLSSEETHQFAKDLGVMGEALDKLVVKHEKASSRIAEVTSNLSKLTGKEVNLSEGEIAGATSVENSERLVRNFKEYVRLMGLSNEQAVEHAQKLGVSGEALKKVMETYRSSVSDADRNLEKLVERISKLTGKNITPSGDELNRVVQVDKAKQLVDLMGQYKNALKLTNEEVAGHARKLGYTGEVLKNLRQEYTSLGNKAKATFSELAKEITTLTGAKTPYLGNEFGRVGDTAKAERLVQLMGEYKAMVDLSNEEVLEHAKKLGYTGEALRRLTQEYGTLGDRAKAELGSIAKELKELTGKNVLSGKGFEFASAEEVARANRKVELVKRYAQMLNLSASETQELARNLGLAEGQLAQLTNHAQRLEASSGGLLSGLKNLLMGGNSMAAFQAALATLGANISIAGVVELGKAMVDTAVKVDSLRTAFNSIYKDGDRAAAQLAYIRNVTDMVGLEFYSTAEAAKGFFAAAENSVVKRNAEDIFRAFSMASSALKLTQEEANRVFFAVSQMMSKGKISAEEMRQQLAETLPGAVQMLATSMGKTLPELDKMFEAGEVGLEHLIGLAKELESTYGDAGKLASKALLGEMNKLRAAWTDFKAEFIDTGFITEGIRKVQEFVQWLKEHIDDLRLVAKNAFAALASGIAVKFSASIVSSIANLSRLSNELVRTGDAATKSSARFKSLILSIGGWGNAIGALVTVISTAFSVFSEKVNGAKYSTDELREKANALSQTLSGIIDATKSVGEEMDSLFLRKARHDIDVAEKDLKKSINSWANVRKEIKGLQQTDLPTWVKETNYTGGILNLQQEISGALTIVDNAKARLNASKISAKEFIGILESQIDRLDKMGLRGSEVFLQLENYYLVLANSANLAAEAQDRLNNKLLDASQNTALSSDKAHEELAFNTPKLATKNLVDELKTSGDFKTSNLVRLLTSGDLSRGSEKFTEDPQKIRGFIEGIKRDGKDVYATLVEMYNLQPEITAELERQAKLESEIANAPIAKKNEAVLNDIDAVNGKLEDLAKAGEYGTDSVAYGLYKIEARARNAKKEVENLDEKFKGVDPSKLKELKDLKFTLIDEERKAAVEAYFQNTVEAGKEAYRQLRELNGETNSAELENTLAKYDRIKNGLLKWKDEEHRLHAGNTEKLKQVDADYANYVEAIEAQKAQARLKYSTKWEDGVKLGWQKYEKSATITSEKVSEVTLKTFTGMGDALANFVTSADKSWKSLGEAFSDLAMSMINDITKIIAHATVMNAMKGMFGGTSFGSFLGMADGGVVNSGLSAFSNGVYNTPTFFNTNGGGVQRYANGGVFGEAGPEAIMPLTRMPNGRLGVAATGGGGGDVQVNVYNNSNSKSEVRQSESSNGGKTIDVIIGDVVAKQMSTPGSKLNRTVTSYTGGQQSVTRR